ncbi:MAG TPA: DUF192 domain-containing protein [Bdellovibrionales bacterium]|nr:DUF192 domain-containing protein [Bdellovibrionales bacterium]
MKLLNKSRNQELAGNVIVANDFFSRAKGLLGTKSFDEGSTLWIRASSLSPCNSVHTFFMRYPIDVVFVDEGMHVKAVYRDLPPWRMTMPIFGAVDAFEFSGGTLKSLAIEIGDQLHVGD